MATQRPRKVKMDTARALGIMGFTSTRWMDASSGMNPKESLDKALFDQMQELMKNKRQASKDKVCGIATKA